MTPTLICENTDRSRSFFFSPFVKGVAYKSAGNQFPYGTLLVNVLSYFAIGFDAERR